MNLLNFVSQYPDESACRIKFQDIRDKHGIVCPRCGHDSHYWKNDRESYECKTCGKRQSLRANTVMHGSQQPFRYWFIAIHLLADMKKSFSASELQRQSGHKYYELVGAMVHKLRVAMSKRDEEYSLSWVLELNEGFFTTEVDDEEKDKPLKRGRGSQRKSKVPVLAESNPNTDNDGKVSSGKTSWAGKKSRKVEHIRMTVMEDLKSETITPPVEANVSKESVIDSDDSSSYGKLKEVVKEHRPQVIPKKNIGKVLPWVHIAINNAMRQLPNISN